MKIDLKSAIAGLIIGALVVFVMGAGDPNQRKYQVAGGSGIFIILDTENGKVWYSNLNRSGYISETAGFWDKKPE